MAEDASGSTRSNMNRSSLSLLGLAIPTLLVALWWFAAHSGGISPVLLPSPEAVWAAFVRMATDGSLAAHVAMSAMRTMTGFVLAAAFGIGCGVWFAVRPAAAAASHLVIEFLRFTPPLALIPVLILWLGIDEAPKIAIVFLSSFFPIYLSVLTAVKGIDPKLAEVAVLLRFTPVERFKMLTLPAALPGILTGLRMGFGYSWRALVGAELIAASSGLGFLITESSEFGKTDVVFVGILTIVVLGIAADALLSRLVSAITSCISGQA